MVGEQSARRTGSASPASTSREPSYGSRACAVRTLSTSSRSPGLPRLAHGVGLVGLVEQLHDVLADRVAVAEPGGERQPVLAVQVDQVLAHLGVDRPLVEERDLVEPAALPGDRVAHHRAAALPGAQGAVGLPLELGRVGPAVPLDLAAVGGAERLAQPMPRSPRCSCGRASSPPARTAGPGRRAARRARSASRTPPSPRRCRRRGEAREQHQAGELEPVAQLVVHAHLLVRRPRRGGVQPSGDEARAGAKASCLGHQADRQPLEDGAGLGRVAQPEPADQDGAVLGDHGPQRVAVAGGPVGRVSAGLGPDHRGLAGLQLHVHQRRQG